MCTQVHFYADAYKDQMITSITTSQDCLPYVLRWGFSLAGLANRWATKNFLPPIPNTGIIILNHHIQIFIWVLGSNSGPHEYVARTLVTKLSSQPKPCFIHQKWTYVLEQIFSERWSPVNRFWFLRNAFFKTMCNFQTILKNDVCLHRRLKWSEASWLGFLPDFWLSDWS